MIDDRFAPSSLLAETFSSHVYRAHDQREGMAVCLKLLRRDIARSDPESVLRFRREATMLAGLSHEHVVRVRAFGIDAGQPYLVTDLIPGLPLDELVAEARPPLLSSLDLLRQVADGVAYVHRHGLVHRDLKPANILVSGHGDALHARIIDFGLAQLGKSAADNAIVGTLRYMAPEQAGLVRRPVGPRSDLYAIGCIAYELLAGVPPFVADDEGELLRLVQSSVPRSLRAVAPDIPVVVERIVAKLLAKNPDDRYHSAQSLAADLRRVTDDLRGGRAIASFALDQSGSGLVEKLGTIFVGRESELAICDRKIGAVVEGKPQLVLVGGRSGAGKSAFVNELHDRTLTRSIELVDGKCYQVNTGFPYFALSEALNECHALVEHRPDTASRRARQDLARSIGESAPHLVNLAPAWRSVFPDAPEVKYEGEEKEREALVRAVAAVFSCLATPEKPLAVFLDDLQWADSGTVEVIRRLLKELDGKPVLLIGAYRSSEVDDHHAVARLRAAIGDTIDGASIELAALTRAELATLGTKLFGFEPPAAFTSTLHERSGGNAFFVWELLRAFVKGGVITENAINLERLSRIELPSALIDVIVQRISQLDASTQRMLAAASMVGHAFTLELLKAALEASDDEIYDALVAAETANLIVPESGSERSYVFAHDKVVEASATLVRPEEARTLHRRLGEHIERSIKGTGTDDEATVEQIFELALHFGQSDDSERALEYARLAGDKARKLLINEEALRHYGRAEEILAARGVDEADEARLAFTVKSAEVLDTMGRYADAESRYRRALQLQSNPFETARLRTKLAYTQQKASRMRECHANLGKALELLGVRLTLDRRLALNLLLARLRYVLVLVMSLVLRRSRKPVESDERAALVHEVLTRFWYFHAFHDGGKHNQKMYYLAYRLLASTMATGMCKELATAHRLMAVTLCQGHRPSFAGAMRHNLRSLEVARRLQLRMEVAVAYCNVGVVHVWQNTPANAIEYLQRAQEMLEPIGNLWELTNAHIFLYMSYRARGRLDDALTHALEIVRVGERANAPSTLASGAMKVGDLLIAKGERVQGEQYLDRALALAEEKKLAFEQFNAQKIKARLWLRQSKYTEARECCERAIELTEDNNFMRAYVYEAYVLWAEAVTRDEASSETLLRKADEYLALAERMERRYRNHLVYALRIRARFEARRGRHATAIQTLDRAMALVDKHDLIADRPPLLEDLAEIRWKHDPVEADRMLRRARRLYEEFGANGEADRLNLLLDEPEGPARTGMRTEKLLESLLEVTEATAFQRDLGDQARTCLDELVRIFAAERAFLFLTDAKELKLQAGRDRDRKDLSQLTAYSTTVVEKVRAEKRPVVVTSTEDGALLGSHSAVVYNLRSIMAAPLLLRDELVGVVYLDNKVEHGLRTTTEVQVLQAIASQIAIAIETSRAARMELERQALANEKALLEKDVVLTATVQRMFLPQVAEHARRDINVAAFYRSAAQCGGDWWWLETRRKDSLVLYVGDVMGHGVAPAMVTASVATAYQLATRDPQLPVTKVLEELNTSLVEVCGGQYYMTMSALEIDDNTGRVRWWNAGGPPLLIADGGAKPRTLTTRGTPLGSGVLTLGFAELELLPGSRLLVFTDGLPELEVRGDKLLGVARLGRLMAEVHDRDLPQARSALVEAMDRAREHRPQRDDLTFAFVERALLS